MLKVFRHLTQIPVKVFQSPLRKLIGKIEIIAIRRKVLQYLECIHMLVGHSFQNILVYPVLTGKIVILLPFIIGAARKVLSITGQ